MGATINLKTLRRQAGRTQKEVAELLGVHVNTYRAWEKDPSSMPHGAWVDTVSYLEIAAQARKARKMATEFPLRKGRFVSVDDDSDQEEYTVPIPEGLTEEFEPSQKVTWQQKVDFEATGKEPYPGYADELAEWERQWELVNEAQAEADGDHWQTLDPVLADPEYTPDTGEPIEYDEPNIDIDPKSGDATLFMPVDGDEETDGDDEAGE